MGVGGIGVGGGTYLVGDLAEEESVARGERLEDGFVERAQFEGVRWREEQGRAVREEERDPAVLAGQRTGPGPDDLAGGGEFVEESRGVPGDPRGEDQSLQGRGRDRGPLQLLDGTRQTVDPAQAAAVEVLPLGEEGGESRGRNRFELLPQGGQGAAAEPAQHGGVAPLLTDSGRVELALHDPARRGEALQSAVGDRRAQAET